MLCPFCSSKTKIYNSRSTHQKTQTWRRHRCLNCNKVFTTREKIDLDGLVKVEDDSNLNLYSRERLLLSIVRASNMLDLPNGMVSELVDTVEATLRTDGFFKEEKQNKSLISDTTLLVLKRYNKNLALLYLNQIYSNQPPLEKVNQLVNS